MSFTSLENAISFVIANQEKYPNDNDHGTQHHIDVLSILERMFNKSVSEERREFCRSLAAVHDMIDHKYKQLAIANTKFVMELIGERGFTIITNMSYSKRNSHCALNEDDETIRSLVMYADWIDSIRLDRCLSYSMRVHPHNYKEKVIEHYYDKLIKLIEIIPEQYHDIALPKHTQLCLDFSQL
jgi:hypothetical protein